MDKTMQTKQFISPLNFPQHNQWGFSLGDILLPSLFHISLPDHVNVIQEFNRMAAEIVEPISFTDDSDTQNCMNWIVTIYNGILDFIKIENMGKPYAENVAELSQQLIQEIYQKKKKKGVLTLLLQMANLMELIQKVNGTELKQYPVEFPNAKNAAEMTTALIIVTDHIAEKLEQKGAKSTTYLDQIVSVFSRMIFLVTLGDHFRKQRVQKKNAPKLTPSTSKKVGRNEPCPCGSGKKYKKCCGAPH